MPLLLLSRHLPAVVLAGHSEHGPVSWNDATPRSTMARVVDAACMEGKVSP